MNTENSSLQITFPQAETSIRQSLPIVEASQQISRKKKKSDKDEAKEGNQINNTNKEQQ